MQPMHVKAGATIFRTGEPSTAVYVIEDGEVAISVGGDEDRTEVARLRAGELFGESGVLESRARSATATAVTETTLLVTDAETFFHAFGMDNDRALSLVKLLCGRLRGTTQRAALSGQASSATRIQAPRSGIRLLPDDERLTKQFGLTPIDVRHLPFQVGNRFGGETLPAAPNHSCCISARGEMGLSAPHFEILRRDGHVGIRDLGSRDGTVVNGTPLGRRSPYPFVSLHLGDNAVLAGRPGSPFRFRVLVRSP